MVVFPATQREHFPIELDAFLDRGADGDFFFPHPDATELVCPPVPGLDGPREKMLRFSYINYWLATLRVYYLHCAWMLAFERAQVMPDKECEDYYARLCIQVDMHYADAVRELFEHYGHDYSDEGPPPLRVV